jgi:DNA-directed RNA polymerase subunit M/transcription elongation factor TFIIS
MIDKIPTGTCDLNVITRKLREVIDAVNPLTEVHFPTEKTSAHKQFHTCPACDNNYFKRLGSSSSAEGERELLECQCGHRFNVMGFKYRRYEITGV